MNRLQIRNIVKDIVKRTDLDSQIDIWINWALTDISSAFNFRELSLLNSTLSTTVGVKTYNFPSDCKAVRSVLLINGTDSRNLVLCKPFETDDSNPYPEADSNAIPIKCVDNEDGTFDLIPIPNLVYPLKIRYYRWHPELLLDTDVPIFKGKDALIVYATIAEVYGAIEEGKSGELALWHSRYTNKLATVIRESGGIVSWSPTSKLLYAKSEDSIPNVPFS